MKKKNKFVQISTKICPRVTDVMELYPWQKVILTDNSGSWYVFEDIDECFAYMNENHNKNLHLIY